MLSNASIRLLLLSFKIAYASWVLPFNVDESTNPGKLSITNQLATWRASSLGIIMARIGIGIFMLHAIININEKNIMASADAIFGLIYISSWVMTSSIQVFYICLPGLVTDHVNSLLFLNHYAGNALYLYSYSIFYWINLI